MYANIMPLPISVDLVVYDFSSDRTPIYSIEPTVKVPWCSEQGNEWMYYRLNVGLVRDGKKTSVY